MDEIERFWAVQAIEADVLHRRERLAAERRAARLAAYRRRAAHAALATQARAEAPAPRWARGPLAGVHRWRARRRVARPVAVRPAH